MKKTWAIYLQVGNKLPAELNLRKLSKSQLFMKKNRRIETLKICF